MASMAMLFLPKTLIALEEGKLQPRLLVGVQAGVETCLHTKVQVDPCYEHRRDLMYGAVLETGYPTDGHYIGIEYEPVQSSRGDSQVASNKKSH